MDAQIERIESALRNRVAVAYAINPNPECAHDDPAFDAWVDAGFLAYEYEKLTGTEVTLSQFFPEA